MGHLGTAWSIPVPGECWRQFAWSFTVQTGAYKLFCLSETMHATR